MTITQIRCLSSRSRSTTASPCLALSTPQLGFGLWVQLYLGPVGLRAAGVTSCSVGVHFLVAVVLEEGDGGVLAWRRYCASTVQCCPSDFGEGLLLDRCEMELGIEGMRREGSALGCRCTPPSLPSHQCPPSCPGQGGWRQLAGEANAHRRQEG